MLDIIRVCLLTAALLAAGAAVLQAVWLTGKRNGHMGEARRRPGAADVRHALNRYIRRYGMPSYAQCAIRWNDGKVQDVTIKLNTEVCPIEDDYISFYADGKEDFMRLLRRDSGEDFRVLPQTVLFADRL